MKRVEFTWRFSLDGLDIFEVVEGSQSFALPEASDDAKALMEVRRELFRKRILETVKALEETLP